MAERSVNHAPPYSEAQTKEWLIWLARGMRQHGQTVFMVEQLQPGWLPTTPERVAYVLVSRLVAGLLYGLIFGAARAWYHPSIADVVVLLQFGFAFGLGEYHGLLAEYEHRGAP